MELSDAELVQRCRHGEVSAFQELVARHYQKVFLVVVGVVNDREDALDIVQEAFFRAYRKIGSFKGDSSFYTWVYRIAVNIAIDFKRQLKRSPTERAEGRQALEESAGDPDKLGSDPARDLQRKQIEQRLLAAINELTPDHRAVIVLRAIEGLSYKDISRILGCSEGTVMSRLHYARKRLLEKLDSVI
ncbi:MAG TPA: sigma-70 family RNA polymerase sigma factor [Candidatus Acidoferrales bacterium]|nr:sigma-70 family RNA polymerase sigma factor [Candidatus Acidoferrales bacterium]